MTPKSMIKPLGIALLALAFGFGLMPMLIYYAGAAALGRYEGGGVGRIYGSVYQGLTGGSVASWIVVLGPIGLLVLMRVLIQCWRWGARTP